MHLYILMYAILYAVTHFININVYDKKYGVVCINLFEHTIHYFYALFVIFSMFPYIIVS